MFRTPVAESQRIGRRQLVERHEGEILAAWTFPANPPLEWPVIVVADSTDPMGAMVAAKMRSAGVASGSGPVVVGCVNALELVPLFETAGVDTPLRRLRRHSLFVVVLAFEGAVGAYFAADPVTGRLCEKHPEPASAPARFTMN
jgi:hypothetical protein